MTILKNTLAALLLALSLPAFALPTLSANAVPNPAVAGAPLNLAINIADIADLYAYEFTVHFDPSLLSATAVDEGGFLGTAGTTFSGAGTIDNVSGTISFIFNTLVGNVAGASGSGILANISFDALAVGGAAISFSDLLFLDAGLNDIAVSAVSLTLPIGAETDVPEPAGYLLLGAGLLAAGVVRRRQRAGLR